MPPSRYPAAHPSRSLSPLLPSPPPIPEHRVVTPTCTRPRPRPRAVHTAAIGRSMTHKAFPIGVPLVPYRNQKDGGWQWIDLWNCLYRDRIIFLYEGNASTPTPKRNHELELEHPTTLPPYHPTLTLTRIPLPLPPYHPTTLPPYHPTLPLPLYPFPPYPYPPPLLPGVNEELGNQLVATMLYLDSENKKDISVYMNGTGGQVVPCLSLHDTMRHIGSDVSTVGFGGCMGMMGFLLAMGQKGKRYVLPNTRVMLHHPSGAARGQASDIHRESRELLRQRDYITALLATQTGNDYDKLKYDLQRNLYMSADDAVDYGVIDTVVRPRRGATR